ncbi:MAG: DUF4173 domain-containing protein [Actinomycetota bacterium]
MAVALAGIAGGWLLVGLAPGLNWILCAAVVAAPVAFAFRSTLGAHVAAFSILSLVLVSVALHTSSAWLLLIDLLVAVALASLAVSSGQTWPGVFLGLSAALWRAPAALAWLMRSHDHPKAHDRMHAALPLARGLLLGGFLTIVFGGLFAAADQAFARLAESVLAVPSVDLGLLPARMVAAGVVATFAGALVSFAPASRVGSGGPEEWAKRLRAEAVFGRRLNLGRDEWITALIMLDVLFAVFVAVQVTVLFGGRAHVLATSGLTYSQYARSGFFELLAVAALTLTVLAIMSRYAARTSNRDEQVFRALGGILIVLALVVLISALKRLALYEEVYGFTRLRFAVHVILLWFAAVFTVVAIAGMTRSARWLPRTVLILSALVLVCSSLIRPDAFIAHRNVERFKEIGKIDISYVRSLSADAVPALATLPEPERSCALVDLRADLDDKEPLWSFNASRGTAREILNNTSESEAVLRTCIP